MRLYQIIFVGLLVLLAKSVEITALYEPAGPVTLLTPSNFDSKIKNGVWMVEFYAPWYARLKRMLVCSGLVFTEDLEQSP